MRHILQVLVVNGFPVLHPDKCQRSAGRELKVQLLKKINPPSSPQNHHLHLTESLVSFTYCRKSWAVDNLPFYWDSRWVRDPLRSSRCPLMTDDLLTDQVQQHVCREWYPEIFGYHEPCRIRVYYSNSLRSNSFIWALINNKIQYGTSCSGEAGVTFISHSYPSLCGTSPLLSNCWWNITMNIPFFIESLYCT